MSLVRLDRLNLRFGEQHILRDASLTLEAGERVCLIGRNGAGKTTLLKVISGEIAVDSGEIHYLSDLRISQLAQTLPKELNHTVRVAVASGLHRLQKLHAQYNEQSQLKLDKAGLRELEALHRRIDASGGWNIEQLVETIISDLQLPGDKKLSELSGGWQRRVALAHALVSKPDLLLLDEPTNHLDLATIDWLEHRIRSFDGSVLFITHDRAFLQKLATRIVELDRTMLFSWPGDYKNYLRRKEKALEDEAVENARFDKKLAQEEVWIRKGIKARRTRNEGRARALVSMREERAQRPERQQTANISIDEAEQSGRKVVRVRNVSYGYGDEKLIDNLSLKIMRGDRIGLIGNNGVGKSTLLRLLLGELEPQSGTIKHGTGLQIGYFDQMREDLDLEKTVADNVGEGRDYIMLNGKERHVIGYLRGFLFDVKRAQSPVKILSGGERNRVILAKLFTRPTNLLVLDEPTNDLDVETLEVLEDRLVNYQGTLLVVSHDREFLDNVVTSILVFEDDGQIREYVGGYSDWVRHGRRLAELDDPTGNAARQKQADAKAQRKASAPRKLSYNEKRELESLPDTIAALESELENLQQQVADEGFYSQTYEHVQPVLDRLKEVNEALDSAAERWVVLEEIQQA
ncbi:MAG: ATP-binding cassette domain-containing protein [Gammaproteobacteria bacterium]|nr:ATP-binding cassette domain-containing protein [Gammaproteobacteria bacterium]NNF65877.1 ATP-binding cassette domain-containing protein [Gammaproteobacteria bacterium]